MQITEVAGYHLAERLGSGGMGDVYRAFHPALNRTAAVKVLHQKEMADRFKNEAYIQSSVSHPNIARLYNYSIVSQTPCIVMEYVEGETLDVCLQGKGKLSSAETENVVLQIAKALAYLHEKEILHRDIKPQNFKIQSDGMVKMLDFGIAKNKYTPKLTQLGFVVGTTEYMAPEQFENKVELKSDIWSLAVLAYELVTGYMPFEASNTMALRSKIIKATFTNPKLLVPKVSEKLQTLIEKNLRANPAARMSAKEIVTLLEGHKQSVFESVSIPKFHRPAIPKLPSSKKMYWYGGAFVLAFILITFYFLQTTAIIDPLPPNAETGMLKKLIEVPGIENAVIIFSNGTRQAVPYEIKGRENETISFTLHADGYTDKTVWVDFSTNRNSYQYNLDKIKD
ncbi:MAG: serine/threonine-protein kinase [Bacteroidota bacterium]